MKRSIILASLTVLITLGVASESRATDQPKASPKPTSTLADHIKIMKDILSTSNSAESLSIPLSQAGMYIRSLTLAQQELQSGATNQALQRVSAIINLYAGPTDNAFSVAAKNFATDYPTGAASAPTARTSDSQYPPVSSYSTTRARYPRTTSRNLGETESAQAGQTGVVVAAMVTLKEKCISAMTSDEFDKALDEFNEVYTGNQSWLYNNRPLQQKMERLQQAARQWARVVAAIENESYQDALMNLSSMESDNYGGTTLFSRKELAAKKAAILKKSLEPSKKATDPVTVMVNDLVNTATNLESLCAIRQKIQNVSRSGYSQNEIQMLVGDLSLLETMNEAVKNGQYGSVLQSYAYRSESSMQHRWKPVTDTFRSQIKNAAIAGLCGLKEFTVGKDETTEQALQANITRVANNKQWDLMLKYLDAYRMAFTSSANLSWMTDEASAIRNFIAAGNFEKAEEYERAVYTYMSVLSTTSKRAPVNDAIDAIKRIKKDHPDAYNKVSKLPSPTNPATPATYDPSSLFRPRM